MGRRQPKPYQGHSLSTLFLRVPSSDWRQVIRGTKSEFRGGVGRGGTTARLFSGVELPTPVVAYRKHPAHGYDRRLMVLTETWIEPLGAIGPESLKREGMPDLAHFRRYWMDRTKRHFEPTRHVGVYRVRLWVDSDEADFSERFFERLYGEFRP